jgi:hypothetical protein
MGGGRCCSIGHGPGARNLISAMKGSAGVSSGMWRGRISNSESLPVLTARNRGLHVLFCTILRRGSIALLKTVRNGASYGRSALPRNRDWCPFIASPELAVGRRMRIGPAVHSRHACSDARQSSTRWIKGIIPSSRDMLRASSSSPLARSTSRGPPFPRSNSARS